MKKQYNLYEKSFEVVKTLGRGSYGTVLKVKLKLPSETKIPLNPSLNPSTNDTNVTNGTNDKEPTEKYYALKKFSSEFLKMGMDTTALREITILKEISHPNIVGIEDFLYGINCCYIAYEFLDLELNKLIYNDSISLTEGIIKNLLHQILTGMDVLNKFGVLHRDIKPQNILITKEGICKIADFGFARFIASPGREMTKGGIATVFYRAPEIFFGAKYYSFGVDMWAVGCVFAEMINKEVLFYDSSCSEIKILTNIFALLGVPDEIVWPNCNQLSGFKFFHPGDVIGIKRKFSSFTKEGVDLLEKMLMIDPNKRISAEDALKHPYFNAYPPMASNEDVAKLIKQINGM